MEISKAQRLFFSLIIPEILDVRVKTRDTYRVVESLKGIPFITLASANNDGDISIDLKILDVQEFSRYLIAEANRFYLASRFTLERARQKIGKSAAWQVIEHYYAAYYSIHYLMRLTGSSVTNLDSSLVKQINISNYSGTATAKITSGLYFLKYNKNNNNLTLFKPTSRVGGSHQEAWSAWEEIMKKISQLTKSDINEYARLSMDLATHLTFLSKNENKYNPPDLRAEINYQFKQKTWLFEQKSSSIIEKVRRTIDVTSINHSSSYDAQALIENNKFIIELANSIFNEIATKYPRSVTSSLKGQYQEVIN